MHLYDSRLRWVAGGPVLPGLPESVLAMRVACCAAQMPPDPPDPPEGFHGRPAFYRIGDHGDIRPLPVPRLGRSGLVFTEEAIDVYGQVQET